MTGLAGPSWRSHTSFALASYSSKSSTLVYFPEPIPYELQSESAEALFLGVLHDRFEQSQCPAPIESAIAQMRIGPAS